jgi:hypothetical protein
VVHLIYGIQQGKSLQGWTFLCRKKLAKQMNAVTTMVDGTVEIGERQDTLLNSVGAAILRLPRNQRVSCGQYTYCLSGTLTLDTEPAVELEAMFRTSLLNRPL